MMLDYLTVVYLAVRTVSSSVGRLAERTGNLLVERMGY